MRLLLLALEPRLLFDASPFAEAAAATGIAADTGAAAPAAHERTAPAEVPAAAGAVPGERDRPSELVLVDARVATPALLDALAGPRREVAVLEAGRDGLAQIGTLLEGRERISALHLVAHGGPGQLRLGSRPVGAEQLERLQPALEGWRAALDPDADILIYGCEVGAGPAGLQFIDRLAQLTGADVSASVDATGGPAADWTLERATGPIEAAALAPAIALERALAASNPTVTLGAIAPVALGSAFNFTLTFDNATATGFGPYIDLYVPATGPDGAGAGEDDGIVVNPATAFSYLGSSLSAVELTFDAGGQALHPYARDASGSALVVTAPPGFQPGDKLYVVALPFGSFAIDQPPAEVSVSATLSAKMDLDKTLPLRAGGGFRFGDTAVEDYATDPSVLAPLSAPLTITPALYALSTRIDAPDGETATGPNHVRTMTVTVDVAPGQTLNGLVIAQALPDDVVITALGAPGASVTTAPVLGAPVTGNGYAVNFATISGSATVSVSFYVPDKDAGGADILDPGTGAPAGIAFGTIDASGQWTPLDDRDPDGPPAGPAQPVTQTLAGASVVAKSLALRKAGPGTILPGGVVQYTLEFDVSDYFAFGALSVQDVLSDGLTYDATFTPSLAYRDNSAGSTTAPITPARTVNGDQTETLTFTLTPLLPSGRLAGDLFADAVQVAGSRGTIVYRASVDDAYQSPGSIAPGRDAFLNEGDAVSNTAQVSGDVLDALFAPTGTVRSDGAGAGAAVPAGSFSIAAIARNGDPGADLSVMQPSDIVTYRLRYALPIGDFENLSLSSFLPLPMFRVADPDANGVAGPAWSFLADQWDGTGPDLPAAGFAKWGAGHTATSVAGVAGISTDPVSNRIEFGLGNNSDPANLGRVVEIVYSARVSTDPFADGLLITNLGVKADVNSSAAPLSTQGTAQITLQQPALLITKGVVATSNSAADVFTPAGVGPGSIAWGSPGGGPLPTGTASSSALSVAPVDSNVAGIDAGDFVRFAIVLQNTGSAPSGAFDITVRDLVPAGFEAVDGQFNLQALRGDGTLVALTDTADAALATDAARIAALFGAGVRLVDSGTGALEGFDAANGRNIAILTYDLRARVDAEAGQSVSSAATLTRFANSEGAPNFVPDGRTDAASVQTAGAQVAKIVAGTDRTFTAGNSVTIGEVITYQVTVTVPEGRSSNVTLVDTLDAGLAFAGVESVIASSGLGTTAGGGSFAAVTPVISAVGGGPEAAGRGISFDFGTVTNAETDNADAETIVVRYRALVLNAAGNQSSPATALDNAAVWDSAADLASAAAPAATVVEPGLSRTLTADRASADADDTVEYTLILTNAGNASAFDLRVLETLATGLQNLSVVSVTGAGGTSGLTDASSGPTLDVRAGEIPVGGSLTVVFRADLAASVALGQVLTVDPTATWTSLPGAATDLIGATSTLDSERTGAGGVNDYSTTVATSVIVAGVQPVLSVVTSESATAGNAVAIGEIVRYRVVVQLPEGVTPSFQLRPALPPGLSYLDDGSTRVALVSSSSSPASLSSSTLGALPGLNFDSDLTPVASVVPTAALPGAAIGGGPFGSGTDPTFSLGTLTNADSDADGEFVVLEFNAIVRNEPANQAAVTRATSVAVLSGASTVQTSTTQTLSVVEPSITDLDKRVLGTDGSTVTYRLTLSNTGSSTAFDTRILDAVPANLANLRNVIVTPAGGAAGVSNASGPGGLDLTLAAIPVGGSATITYQADVVDPSLPVPSSSATLSYTSLTGTGTALGGSTQGVTGSAAGERSGGGGVNDYSDADPAGLSVLTGSLWEDLARNGGSVNRVRDPNELALANVTVNLRWAGPNGVLDDADDVVLATQTGPGGGYSFGALPAGNYRVSLDRADPDFAGFTPSWDIQGAAGDASARLTLGEGVNRTGVNFTALGPNAPPAFAGLDASPAYVENGAPVVLDADAVLSDPELDAVDNWNRATLTVQRAGAPSAQDVFGATGTLALVGGASGNLELAGLVVGTYTNSAGRLAIAFNGNATAARVDSVLRQITYANASDAPPASVPLSFTVNDANAGLQGTGGARSASGTLNVAIAAVNDAPAGADRTVSTLEDTPRAFTLADFAFTDVDSATLQQVRITSLPGQGTLRLNGVPIDLSGGPLVVSRADILAGRLSFTPAPNGNGSSYASFQFQVGDGTDFDPTPNTMTIDVVPVDDAPASIDKVVGTNEDTPRAFSAADFAFVSVDPTDSFAAVRIDTLPANGALTLAGRPVGAGQLIAPADLGALVFTPASDAFGIDNPATPANDPLYTSFLFSVRDSAGTFSPAPNTMSVLVFPVEDAPVARPDLGVTPEDTPVRLDLLANDTDAEGGSLTIAAVNGVAPVAGVITAPTANGGTVTVTVATGAVIFTPGPDYNGTDSFTYTVRDPSGTTATATATVTVVPANDAPAGADAAAALDEDSTRSFTAADFNVGFGDPDGDPLRAVRIDRLPTRGSLTLDGVPVVPGQIIPAGALPGLRFTPAPDENGAGYASFQFSVGDGQAFAATPSTFTLNVNPVNDPPIARADFQRVDARTSAPVAGNLIRDGLGDTDGVDSDPDGDALRVASVQRTTAPGGALTPIAPGGSAVVAGRYGTLTLNADGSYTYTLDTANAEVIGLPKGQSLTETFDYTVDDRPGAGGLGASASLAILISGENDAPVAQASSVTATEDLPFTFAPGDFNFTDPDTIPPVLAAVRIDTLPARGTLTLGGVPVAPGQIIAAADIGRLQFRPAPDENGAGNPGNAYTSFEFSVSDGESFSAAPAPMGIAVLPVNDPPVPRADVAATPEDTPVIIEVRGNDTDVEDGTPALLSVGGLSPGASAVIQGDGTIRYTPPPDFSGTDTFTYTVQDANGASATTTVTVVVTPVSDPPLGANLTRGIDEDTSYAFLVADFTAVFADPDAGDTLAAVRIDTLPAQGSLTLNGQPVLAGQAIPLAQLANLRFTPRPNDSGAAYAGFQFSVGDGQSFAAAPAVFTIDVNPVNDAPSISTNLFLPPIVEESAPAGRTVTQILSDSGATFQDIDPGAALAGVAITGNAANPATQGTWQYSTDGANWFPIAAVSEGAALVLPASAQIRFAPVADYSGTPGPLTLRALDNTYAAGFSSTAAGVESRVTLDATVNGATTPVAAFARSLGTQVTPLTDVPVLAAANASGNEDTPIPLAISATAGDTDGSETVTAVTLSGLPPGALLRNAAGQSFTPVAGSVALTPAQLAGLVLVPPRDLSGTINLSIQASARDGAAAPAFATAPLVVTVAPVSDPPIIAVGPVDAPPGRTTPLPITVTPGDIDGSETLSPVTISGLPPGATLTNALGQSFTAASGSVTLPVASLAGLAISVPPGASGIATITVTASSIDGAAAPAFASARFALSFEAPYAEHRSGSAVYFDYLSYESRTVILRRGFDPALFVLPAVSESLRDRATLDARIEGTVERGQIGAIESTTIRLAPPMDAGLQLSHLRDGREWISGGAGLTRLGDSSLTYWSPVVEFGTHNWGIGLARSMEPALHVTRAVQGAQTEFAQASERARRLFEPAATGATSLFDDFSPFAPAPVRAGPARSADGQPPAPAERAAASEGEPAPDAPAMPVPDGTPSTGEPAADPREAVALAQAPAFSEQLRRAAGAATRIR